MENPSAACREACEIAGPIPGWLEPEVAEYLYRVGAAAEGDVLEVGTYFGKSTFLIARGMRDAGRAGKLVTVDVHWRGINEATGKPFILAEDSQLSLCRTLKLQGLEDRVIQVIGWSRPSVLRLDFRDIRTVFIDGGHDYESCSGDFLAVREKAPPDRPVRLMFHDYGRDFPGVQRTIDELVKRDERYRHVAQVATLFVCDLVPASGAGPQRTEL
jgi:hypothetical protein